MVSICITAYLETPNLSGLICKPCLINSWMIIIPSQKLNILHTARVSAREGDSDAPDRQKAYLKALEAYIPTVSIY